MKLAIFLPLGLAMLSTMRPVGLDFTHRHSPTKNKYLIETMGGGIALLDYNNDGLLDVFCVNGGRLSDNQTLPADFERDKQPWWDRLFRQEPDGSFRDVTAGAGLSASANVYGMGVATGDYDNDGFTDLYVTGYGRNQLYRNTGNGTFVDVTGSAGVGGGGWSVSAAFVDYDNDGLLDLFVARYLDYTLERNVLCGEPFHAYCRPEKYEGTTNLLYRNEGNGRFRDVSRSSGIAAAIGKGMGVAVHDYDGDGFADIFVSNDLIEQFLFRNRGDGTFEECSLVSGAALSPDGKPFSGMGAAFADYDNDGRPDIVVTNLAREKWALYRNEGGGQFSYASLASGLAAATARSSGWGVGLYDFDNDGWKDLVAAQSHVLDNVERIDSAIPYREPPGIYRNTGGKFQLERHGSLPAVAGRGAAFGDLNNDGRMDAVIAVLGGQPLVLSGQPSSGHWLILQLTGAISNKDGIGATVRIGNQMAYSTTSGSYLSASDRRVHFGLGDQREVKVEIAWPSGKKQVLNNVRADQILKVTESR